MSEQSSLLKEFFKAVKDNDTKKIVKMVREKGVDVDSRDCDNDDCTALHVAAANGNFDLVKTLVEDLKADINMENIGGEVPMHIAAADHRLNLDIVRYLYDKGSIYGEDVEDILVKNG